MMRPSSANKYFYHNRINLIHGVVAVIVVVAVVIIVAVVVIVVVVVAVVVVIKSTYLMA